MKLDLKMILNELTTYRERRAAIQIEHTALLVIDLQIYFYRFIQPVLKNIQRVVQSCREKAIPIIFTQHGHTDVTLDGGALREWWGQVILYGTKDWRFIPEVDIDSGDTIIQKKRYSAFYETDLEKILREKGIQDLIITGVMTNLCCETTARDAFMRDFRVFFLIDGTATGKEDHHLATLKNLGYGFAYLLTCDELIEDLK